MLAVLNSNSVVFEYAPWSTNPVMNFVSPSGGPVGALAVDASGDGRTRAEEGR